MSTEAIRPVVVGIDDSDESRVALRWAADVAARRGAPLEVVHAWREPTIFIPHAYPPDLVELGRMDDAAREFINTQLAAVAIDQQTVLVTPIHGHAAGAILKRAGDAQLVVVGRHGAGGHPVLGSTAAKVARHARCSVAVVPGIPSPLKGRVVVGVDTSAGAAAALRWAVDEAARTDTTLDALLAWSIFDQPARRGSPGFDPDFRRDSALEALNAAITDAVGADHDAIERHVVNDHAGSALVDASKDADLVVVGRRGVGGFKGLLLGSVSRHLLDHSPVPAVVIVPSEIEDTT